MNFFGKSIKEFGVIVGIFALFVYAGCQNDISSSQNAEFGQVVVSSENRALYTSEIKSAKVSVRGYDSSGSTFVKTSGIVSVSGGKADNIAVSEIPLCSNAVVLVQGYTDASGTTEAKGMKIAAVTEIKSGSTPVNVTWSSSRQGFVYAALLDASVNTNALSSEAVSAIDAAIPSDTHASLIDAAGIATAYKSDSLGDSSSYKLTAGTVNVTCNNYDGCTLQINDPLSSTETASTSSTTTIKNVAPGTWTLYVLDGTTVKTTKTVTVTSGGTTSVTVGTPVITDRIIVHAKNYPAIYVFDTTGVTTGSYEMTSEGDDWYTYTLNVTSAKLIFKTSVSSWDGQTGDLTRTAGEWWFVGDSGTKPTGTWYDSNPDAPLEPVEPGVSISPVSGSKIALNGSISVQFDDGNDTISSAKVTINGTEYDMGTTAGTWSKSLSEMGITSVGTTVTVNASVTNSAGTGTASANLTTKDAPVVNADFNNLRIYQVMVSSFQDGDPSIGYSQAYGPSGALTGGDLQGIINAIDYIKDLGCNALWMTPIFDSSSGSSNEYLNSTGYFTYDYFNVDPKFGTNDKFRELVEKCHENGLYVILDGVFGHWGDGGAKASPNGKTPTRSHGQYKACDYPSSLDFFKEVAQYWIKEYQIDGWRLDQCYQAGLGEYGNGDGDNCYTGGHNYWYDLRKAVEEASATNEGQWGTLGYMVGEHWNGNASIIQNGSIAKGSAAGYGLRSCFDFPSRYKIVQSLATEESKEKSGASLAPNLSYVYGTYTAKGYTHDEGYYPNLFVTNHDLVRFGNLINWKFSETPSSDNYWKRHKLSLAIVAAYTGPITIYYGDEWGAYVEGYSGPGSLGAYNDNAARSTGKISGFSTNEQNLHDYAASLMEMRANHEALWNGTNTDINATGDCYVGKKVGGGETIIYAINNGSSSSSFSATGTDLITGETVSGTATVGAYSARFILCN